MAGARRRASEQIGARAEGPAETAQQRAALLQSDQGISGIDLKVAPERRRVDGLEGDIVDAIRLIGIGGEAPLGKHVEARNGKPF